MCDSHLSADDAHEQASRMSALDLYEDLLIKEDGGDDGDDRVLTMQEILSEKHSLEEKNAALLQRLSESENLVKDLESKHVNLQKNFNNLLATAKVELDRKNSLLSHYAGGSSAPVARSIPSVSHCTKEQDRSSRKKKGLLDMFKGRRLNDDELAAMKSSGPGTSHTPNSLTTLLQHRGEKMVGVATRVIGSSFENMASVTSMNTPFNHQKTVPQVSNNGGQSSNFMDESSEPPTHSSSNIQQGTVDASTSNSRRSRPTACDLGQRSRSVARVTSENIGPRTPSPPPVVRNSKNVSRAPSISTPRTSNSSEPQIVSEPRSRSSATSSNLDTRFDANPTGSQYLSRLGVDQSKRTVTKEITDKSHPQNSARAKNAISHPSQTPASRTQPFMQPSNRKSFVSAARPDTGAFDSQRSVESREKRSRTTSKEFIERPESSADSNIAGLKNGISNESRKFSARRSSQSETQPGSDRNRRSFENPKWRSRSNSEEVASIMKAWDSAVAKVKNTHKAPANAATPTVYDERAKTPEAQLPRPTSRNSLSDRNLIAEHVESRHLSKGRADRSSSTAKERTGNAQTMSTKFSENRKSENRTLSNRGESSQDRVRSMDFDNGRYYESSQRQRTSSDRRVDDVQRSSSRHREKEHPRRNSGSRSTNRGSDGRDNNDKSNPIPIKGQERSRDERRDKQPDLRRSKNIADSNSSQKNESRKSRGLREKIMRGDKLLKNSPKKFKSGAFVSPKKNRKSFPERHSVEAKATSTHTEKSKSKAGNKGGLDPTLNQATIGAKTHMKSAEIETAAPKNKLTIPPESNSRQRPRTPKKLPRTPPPKSTTGDTKKKAEGTEYLEETKTSGAKKPSISGKSHSSDKTKERGNASSVTTTKKSPRRATPKKKKTPKNVIDTLSNISGDGVSSIAREKTFPCPPSPARSDSREMFGQAQSPAELELDYDENSLMYREIMQPDTVADRNLTTDETPVEAQMDKTRTEISEEAQLEETATKTAKTSRDSSEKSPFSETHLKNSTPPKIANLQTSSMTESKGAEEGSLDSNVRPSTERDIAGVLLSLASSPKYQPRVHLFNISKSPLSKGIKRKTSFETSSVSPSIKKTKTTQNDKHDRVSESKSSLKRKPNLTNILPSESTSEMAKTNAVPPPASKPENDRKNLKKDLRTSVARVSPPGTPVNTSLMDVAMEVEVETSPKFHAKSKEKSRNKKSKKRRLKVKLKLQKKKKREKIQNKEITVAETKKVSKETCMASSFSSTLNSSDFFPDLSSSSSSSETAPIRPICEAPPALCQWLDSAKKKKLKTGETQEKKYINESLQKKADDTHAAAELERDRMETENAVASICEEGDQFSVDDTHLVDSQSVITSQNTVTKNPMRFYCNAALKFLFHLAAEKLKTLRETSEQPLDLSLRKKPQPADTVKTATKEQHPAAVVNLFSGAKAPNTTKTSQSQHAEKAPEPKSCHTPTSASGSGGCSNASEGENFDKLLQKHAEEQKNLKRKDEPDKRQQPPPKKKPRRVALERVEMPEPIRKQIVSPPLSRSLWMTSLVKCQQRRKVRSRWSSEVSESEEQPQCSSETLATNNNEVTEKALPEKETLSATTNAGTPTKLRIKPVLPNSVLGLKRKNSASKTNKPMESSCLQDSSETASSSSSRFSVGELLPDMSSSSWQLSEESRCRLQSFAKAVNFLSPLKSSPKTQRTTPQKVNAAKEDVKRRVLQSP